MNRKSQVYSVVAGMLFACAAYADGQLPHLVFDMSGMGSVYYVPTADKYFASVGTQIEFDLSSSFDPDGGDGAGLSTYNYITIWDWDFGDGCSYSEGIYYMNGELTWGQSGDIEGDEYEPFGVHVHTYDSPGEYTVTFKVYDDDNPDYIPPGDPNQVSITLVVVGLSVSGSGSNTMIAVNNDDDNSNQVLDNATGEYSIDGEDDLVSLSVGLSPADKVSGVGFMRVSIVDAGAYLEDELYIWSTQTKGNQYIPQGRYNLFYQDWAPQNLPPQPMWVEADSMASDQRFVKVEYYVNGTDQVAWEVSPFTICSVDMNVSGVSESQESVLGAYIPFNGDDDNDNEVVDKDDTPPVSGEDDLVSLADLNVYPLTLPIDASHAVTLDVASGSSKIRIYANEDKSGGAISLPITFTDRATMESATYYIEGDVVSDSSGDVTVTLSYEGFTDVINLTVFDFRISKCPSSFMPKGGDEDNSVQITAEIEPDDLTGTMKFTLFDVSSEPGFCLNKPASIPGSGEDSSTWKDLQFDDPQTGFTVSGVNKDVATTTTEVYTKTVEVNCYDYGAYGDIKAEIQLYGTWYTAHVEVGTEESARIPQDSIESNTKYISVAWEHHGDYDDDDDTSDDNNHDGDGLTRYEEYRGVDYDDDNISERLSPEDKDLFVHGSSFGGGFPSFAYGAAFSNAGIAVHEFVGTINTDDRGIDVLVVTATNNSHDDWGNGGHIGHHQDGIDWWTATQRHWTFNILGSSDVGNQTKYGDRVGYCYVYKTSINYYFDDKPYVDGLTLNVSTGLWEDPKNGELDPLANVEDRNDTGMVEHEPAVGYSENDGDATFPPDNADGTEFDADDGDYPVVATGDYPWEYNHDLSPLDIDNDRRVELPPAEEAPVSGDYSIEHVVQHIATHEMGHAVGVASHCGNGNCVMHEDNLNWDRGGYFCIDCGSQIYIHNE